MELEKIAEASHQAWFVAMAKQGWIFGPRLNPDFKTHPWLKPYLGLSDGAKEIVRAQVRGTLGALEAQGYLSLKPGTLPPQKPVTVTMPAQAAPKAEAAPTPPPAAKAEPAPVPAATPTPKAAPADEDTQVIERRVDASGRMRIGAGLVKKADLLRGGNTQVAIVQRGDAIEVLPYDPDLPDAFFASVNPDGFMLPKAMLASSGAKDFILTLSPGRLAVRPK